MKVVILAGGFGTRISEESHLRPKPMIEIGGMPILWHIMKQYSSYGYNEFIICAGYKANFIKQYFSEYYLYRSDITFDFSDNNNITIHSNVAEPWKVTIVDTGLNTMTGGRVKRIKKYVGNEPFMLTYGDGVSDINIKELVEFHKSHGKIGTISAYQPEGRYGVLDLNGDSVDAFREKDRGDSGFINCGFMILNPEFFDYIEGDSTVLEQEPLRTLSNNNELMAYRHCGFWQCMDTLRDKEKLTALWDKGQAPWKVWEE